LEKWGCSRPDAQKIYKGGGKRHAQETAHLIDNRIVRCGIQRRVLGGKSTRSCSPFYWRGLVFFTRAGNGRKAESIGRHNNDQRCPPLAS